MTAVEIENATDTLGAEFGFDVSASTISLHAQVIRRNVEPFIDLLARVVATPAFAVEELEKLKRETVAELLETRDNDRALASIALKRTLFSGHPFARSASGRMASVPSITRDDVVAMHARLFVRSNIVLGFAGAISEPEAHALGARLITHLPEGTPMQPPLEHPAGPTGRHLVFVDKPERTQSQILIGTLGTLPSDADHWPLVAATAVFGGTFTSRMMNEIRSKRGWSYSTGARLAIDRVRHAFTMSAFPAANDCAPCLALELSMLEKLTRDGITARELGFIKNYMIRSHAFEIDTAPKRLGHALESELMQLPAHYHDRYVDHVRSITLEQANAAIRNRLSPDNLIVSVLGTARDTFDAVCNSIPNLASNTVIAYDAEGTLL